MFQQGRQKNYWRISVLIREIENKMIDMKKEILQTIYHFYPRNVFYNRKKGRAYKKTQEYKRLKQARKRALKNRGYSIFLRTNLESLLSYDVKDLSDVRVSFCYRYDVLLHKGYQYGDEDEILRVSNDAVYLLIIVVSYLEKYYFHYVLEMRHQSRDDGLSYMFRDIFLLPEFAQKEDEILEAIEIKNVDSFFEKMGYRQVPRECITMKIKDIETEYEHKGNANVYDCLFSDLI